MLGNAWAPFDTAKEEGIVARRGRPLANIRVVSVQDTLPVVAASAHQHALHRQFERSSQFRHARHNRYVAIGATESFTRDRARINFSDDQLSSRVVEQHLNA